MAKKLKNVLVNSVDLCKQGANQRAFICLKKSVEEGNSVSDIKTSIIQNVCKELNISIEDVCEALGFCIQEEETQQQKMKKAMEKSFMSVLQDESKTAEQKQQILQKSVNEFFDTVYNFAKSEQKTEQEEQEAENMDINKMTDDDKAIYEKLKKKYKSEEQTELKQKTEQKGLHPEVKKALQEAETAKKELEKLKKSLELKEFEGIAKQYEVIGKNTEELVPKLYELKKSNEQAYDDYIATLNEMVEMTQASGIFKEYGSSRAGTGSQKQSCTSSIFNIL